MRAVPTLLACCALAVAPACADEPAPGTPDAGPSEPDAGPDAIDVVVGGADRDGNGHTDLVPGQDIELRPGAQGGFHIWINPELRGMSGDVFVEREARRESDGQLVLAATRGNLVTLPAEAETEFWHGDRGAATFMCPAPVGIQVFDTPLQVIVRITNGERDDERVVYGQGSIVVVPRCPNDDLTFCQNICSGN